MAIKKTKEKFKFVDLFAGIGGFHFEELTHILKRSS